MANSKFNLEAGYMKIISPGSEHSAWLNELIKLILHGIFHPGLKIFIF